MDFYDKLIKTSACEQFLATASALKKNMSPAEGLTAIATDLSSRQAILDEFVYGFMDSTWFDALSEFNIPGEHLKVCGPAQFIESTDFIIGRKKDVSGSVAQYLMTNLSKGFTKSQNLNNPYHDYIYGASMLVPVFKNLGNNVVSSKCSLCYYAPGPGEMQPDLPVIDQQGNVFYVFLGLFNNSRSLRNESILICNLVPATPSQPDPEDLAGAWISLQIPTDYCLSDENPDDPERWEYFGWDDFAKLALQNSTIYDICQTAIETVGVEGVAPSDFAAVISAKFPSLAADASQVVTTFLSNGLTLNGMVTTLRGIFDTDSIEATDDYHFAFTDNSTIRPVAFLGTLIATTLTAVGSLLAVVGGFIGKVVGVCMLIIGGIIKFLGKIFDNLSDTYCNWNPDANINGFAPGFLQIDIKATNFDSWFMDLLLERGAFYYKYIGGDYFFFIHNKVTDAQGNIDLAQTDIGVEFHVGTDVPYSPAVRTYLSSLYNYQGVVGDVRFPKHADVRSKWEEFIESTDVSTSNYIEQLADRPAMDLYLRKVFLVNFAFACLYLYSNPNSGVTRSMGNYNTNSAMYRILSLFAAIHDDSTPSWSTIMNVYGTGLCLWGDAYAEKMGATSALTFSRMTDTFYYDQGFPSVTAQQMVVLNILASQLWIEDYFSSPILSAPQYSVEPPRYDRSSFWLAIIFEAIVVAAVVTTVVIGTIRVKRKVRALQANRKAQAEAAWSAYSANPSQANYNAYRTAVKRNNRLATFTGGSKLAYSGYWDDATGSSDITNTLLDKVTGITDKASSEGTVSVDLTTIARLINHNFN